MDKISSTKHLSTAVDKSSDDVYSYVSNPENFPKWLAFATSISKKSELVWVAKTNLGTIEMEMTPPNEFGIVDHKVKLPDGTVLYNPLRVIKNGASSEVVFTLFKAPNKTTEEFENDAALVEADLKTLKSILEAQ
ncbi:hypothetical protein ACI6PS_12645 [Flavobacterium sp. PLA-1-15]|uniref:hypothetical protein n=1 Tax=Flavobacterium sp. PLA-1-15 TaxID=3380533 RepID=UPI003B780ECA